MIVVTLIVCFLCIVLTANCGKVTEDDFTFQSITESSVIIFHGYSNQGMPTEPIKFSTHVVFVTIYLTMMLFWFAHSAVLTSFLAAKIETPPFESLEELLQKTNYKIVTFSGGFYETVFKVRSRFSVM